MIIGRKRDIAELIRAYNSGRPEFIAIYGRRRVGKTYLVRQVFKDKFTFTYSGVPKVSTKEQLRRFHKALMRQGMKKTAVPENWFDAFDLLYDFVVGSTDSRKVIFIDELPWMDGPKSSFLPAFENLWNGWLSARDDVMLVVCGSSTSWIINKVIKNHGGLYNRLTNQIYLEPFTLAECKSYAESMRIRIPKRQIIEAYMVLGGIPFYWSLLQPAMSVAQNIDNLFFEKGALLKNEFSELFASLFKSPEPYEKIIEVLATRKAGMTRDEIASKSGLDNNGGLTRLLGDLDNCGFIRRYVPPGVKTRGTIYQIIDNFTLFYFQFLANGKNNDRQYWSKLQISPTYTTWSGLAFERVCLLHSDQIKKALGISGIITNVYAWQTPAKENRPGAQIDLLIERSDNAIHICEMKFNKKEFTITEEYDKKLRNKINRFSEVTKTKKALLLTLITAEGLTDNEYARDIPIVLTSDCLFD